MQKMSIAIFAIAFLSINCSFLRNLDTEISITANSGEFTPSTTSCFNKDVKYSISITGANAALDKLTAKLNNDVEITCEPIKSGDTKINCVGPSTGIEAAAEYNVKSIVKADDSQSEGVTLTGFSDNHKITVVAGAELGTVNATQSVDASKKEAFKIAFATTVTTGPKIYVKVGTGDNTALPDGTCTFSATSHETSCTLKEGNGIVKDKEEATILYEKGCKVVDTGIKVKYSSASFAKIGALIFAIALLF